MPWQDWISEGKVPCMSCGTLVCQTITHGFGWSAINYKCSRCGEWFRNGKEVRRGRRTSGRAGAFLD